MNGQPGVRVFLIQYFPVFMGAIFASVFALVFAVPLFLTAIFKPFRWRITPSGLFLEASRLRLSSCIATS